ncbi:MAG: FixH family protein [Verrucomicrobiales bacterium]|nr:FixH family protein [Verrucomicrobiales bacterium]
MNPAVAAPPLRVPFNPWPWSLLAFFALLLTTIASFVVFAVRQNQELVRPDYYEQELRHEAQMKRVQRTRALAGPVSVEAAEGVLSVTLPAAHAGRGFSGTVRLYRPSDARLDRELTLAPDGAGHQSIDVRPIRPGLWKAALQWTAGGVEYFHEESIVINGTPR